MGKLSQKSVAHVVRRKNNPDDGGFHTTGDMAYIFHMEPMNALGYAPRCSQCGHIRPNSKCCGEKGCYKGGDIICVKKDEKCP